MPLVSPNLTEELLGDPKIVELEKFAIDIFKNDRYKLGREVRAIRRVVVFPRQA
jgi:hypothetical protein